LESLKFIPEKGFMKAYSILVFFLLCGCSMELEGDDRLNVVNRTDYRLVCEYNIDSIPKSPSVINTDGFYDHPVNIDDSIKLVEYSLKPWPRFFERSKNKKLNLFIYNIDSLRAYKDIDTLIKRKIYKRLEYSEQDLNRLNWTVDVKN